jgi:hypothetical protein
MELLTVALATFTAVIFTLGLLPFRIARRLMPLAVSAAGYGMTIAYDHAPRLVMGAAVAGLVTVVTRYAVIEAPEPWSFDDFLGALIAWIPERPSKRAPAPRGLPRGVGRRIPYL